MTAVDWVINELWATISLQQKHIDEIKERAKLMEKQQINDAYKEGCFDSILDESTDLSRAEEYYNNTFKTK
jgi:hypothetical protein